MSPFPELFTQRLYLRELTADDRQAIFELRSDTSVGRYIDRPLQQNIDEASAFIDRIRKEYANEQAAYWILCLKKDDTFVGTICLWNFSADGSIAEIGYEMLPQHHGLGYMQEAVEAVCHHAFGTLRLAAIEAFTHRENTRSQKLLEKNDFILCPGRTDPDVPENIIYCRTAVP